MAIKHYETWSLKHELERLRIHQYSHRTVVMAEEIPAEEKKGQSGKLLILNNTPEETPKSVAMHKEEAGNDQPNEQIDDVFYQSSNLNDDAVNGYLINSKYNQGVLEITIQKCTVVQSKRL